ncbi:hypothetical protein DFH05DRAFT_735327 [Lentinula detonsa]|uniref:Bromo domain-containing protein n=1 Tax=Lentinula detonsa TaxID=2804962 RepID=A0A9W8TSS1_9AGAR|nr:hypothetical protein DFH05DRAFT_735327 [Lentinula detonsa]
MTLTPSQKSAISSILDVLLTAVATPPSKAKPGELGVGGTGIGTGRGRKRLLSGMFLISLDQNDWAEYYDLIPNPRALHPIRDSLAENKYKDALEVYTDLSLVFWNAIFYNERDSQISKDAAVLKTLLDIEWAKRAELPQPRSHSPPPGSAQKAYPEVEEKEREKERIMEQQMEREKEANAKNNEKQVPQVPQQPQVLYQPLPAPSSAPDINDMEVDVPDTESELDQSSDEGEADDENESDCIDGDLIVRHLESSLPRWPGFTDDETEGWLTQGSTESYLELIHAVKGHKDVIGNRLAAVLESIPDVIDGPTSACKGRPISIKAIETRIKSKAYSTPASFDRDMMLLFEKGRRWWEPAPSHVDSSSSTSHLAPSGKPKTVFGGSREEYAKVLILQRLYQSLTSPHLPERHKPGSGPYSSETNFAALRVGPGRVNHRDHQNQSEGEEIVFASGSKQIHTITNNRVFLDQIKYKGWTVRVGDWVHLANGTDMYSGAGGGGGGGAGRPTVAQVWKVWQTIINTTNRNAGANGVGPSGGQDVFSEKEGQYGITVCWYYRPEETFHSPQRVFWENEIFKSNHFASHPLSDILEPIFVQHTRPHIRGRPRGWYPGWPLYICDSRYSYSRGYRNYRNRARGLLGRSAASSAFVRIKSWNSCMPSEILAQISKSSQRAIYPFENIIYPVRRTSPFVVGGGGPGGLVEDGVPGTVSGPTKGALAGSADVAKSMANALQYLQQYANVRSQSQPYSQNYPQSTTVVSKPSKPDRTSTVYAMAQVQGVQADLSMLPKDTTRHFSRDPSTGSLLWFPSAPVNVPGRSGNAAGTTGYTGPNSRVRMGHSLEYLHWRAMKVKSTNDTEKGVNHDEIGLAKRKILEENEVNGGGIEREISSSRKKRKSNRTAAETLAGVSNGT